MTNNIDKIQKDLLTKLNAKEPLSNFCEHLEEVTNGQFTFTTFQNELKTKYNDALTETEYKTFFKNISLDEIQITIKRPYINIFYLFEYFMDILSLKIVSPILSFYSIANQIHKKRNYPTLKSYLTKIKSKFSNPENINVVKFDTIFVNHKQSEGEEYMVNLDSIDVVCVFKALDYNKKNVINFNDLCAVIESYYNEDDLNEEISESDLKGELFKTLINKYSINLLNDVFKGNKTCSYQMNELIKKLKDIIQLEIRDNKLIDLILKNFFYGVLEKRKLNDNETISYNDIDKKLKEIQSKSRKQKIFLSDFQRDNLQKYLNHLKSLDISTDLMFQYAIGTGKKDKIFLDSLKNQLSYLLHQNNEVNMEELQNIRDAFDYNKLGTLTKKEYNIILSELESQKEISVLEKYKIPQEKHHLFPLKGNVTRYQELQKEINRLIFLNSEEYQGHQNINIEDYQDDNFIITALEKVDIEYPYMTCYDLITYLNSIQDIIYKKPKKNIIKKIIMLIDTNKDGYVSGIDMINFMLSYLQHKSTIIARKYIMKRVKKQYKSSMQYFIKENYKDYSRETILSSKQISDYFLKYFEIPKTVTKQLVKEFKTYSREPFLLYDFICLFDESNNTLEENATDFLEDSFSKMDIQDFENSLTKIVCDLIDMNNFYLENSSKENQTELMRMKFNENLDTALKLQENQNDIKYNLDKFKKLFIQPLKIDMHLGKIIYYLLKPENEDCIHLNNIKTFLYSFMPPVNTKSTNELIDLFNKSGVNIKQPIEMLLFNKIGNVSIVEIMNTFIQYYPRFDRSLIKQVVSAIDVNKNGFVSYRDIQLFFKDYLQNNKFSYIIELKHIMSKLFKEGNITYSSEEYFYSENTVNDFTNVQKREHNSLFKEFCGDNNTLDEFYNSILQKQGRKDGYDLKMLCDDLNFYSCCIQLSE